MRLPRAPSDRDVKIALAALALAVRLPFLVQADFVSYDGTYYINQAKALLDGSLAGGSFPIGYPVLIAPVLALVGDGVLAGALVSLVASVGSVWVFEALCRRHMGRGASILAAVVFAITPVFIRASVLTFSESAYTFWVLLALLLFDARPWASGLALGMAAATRPEAVAIAAALVGVAAHRLLRRRSDARPRAPAVFVLGFLVVYGAGAAALSVAHGHLTLLSRVGAFESVTLPWQLREKSIDYAGKQRVEDELEHGQPAFDRSRSYQDAMAEEVSGLARQLVYLVPALAVLGIVTRRGIMAVALVPLVFIPFFVEARGQVRWLVPYLAPIVFYAVVAADAVSGRRARAWVMASVLGLAVASVWINRGVLHSGTEREFESTRDIARRFASRVAHGDAVADRKPYFAFYSGARYVEIPAAPYDETITHLARTGVRYLSLHAKTVDRLRPALRRLLFDESAVRGELRYRQVLAEPTGEIVYERTGAADSLSARRLTHPEVGDMTPAWSPDGRWVAFRRLLPEGDAAICIVDRDGESTRELVHTSRERDPIAWSPDGARVVYTATVDDRYELVSVDARSGRLSRLESTTTNEWSPSFARDTGALAFCSDRGGSPAVWKLERGARKPKLISPQKEVTDYASLSPSGRRVAWVDLEGRLIFWDLEACEGMGVFEPRGVISSASWSPDESTVVVEAYDWGAPHLYIVDSKNGRALMLTRSRSGEGMPSWSPDGSEIVAVSATDETPSLWVFGHLAPYIDRLGVHYDVKTLQRPEPLWTPPPGGLRRVFPSRSE